MSAPSRREQLGEQTARRLVDQIERAIEALGLAEEWIRHVLGARMRSEIEEAADLVPLAFGASWASSP